MLHLSHDKPLPDAFNVSKEEREKLIELIIQLMTTKGKSATTTWLIERLWIDEQFSDNLKAMAIYLLGYSQGQVEKGGETWMK